MDALGIVKEGRGGATTQSCCFCCYFSCLSLGCDTYHIHGERESREREMGKCVGYRWVQMGTDGYRARCDVRHL